MLGHVKTRSSQSHPCWFGSLQARSAELDASHQLQVGSLQAELEEAKAGQWLKVMFGHVVMVLWFRKSFLSAHDPERHLTGLPSL